MQRAVLSCLGLVLVFTARAQAQLTADRVTTGLSAPMFATTAPGDPNTLYILERGGAIKTLNLHTGSTSTSSFFNITGLDTSGEGGALGLAFHPDYATNGKFYAYVTVGSPFRSVIREYTNNNGTIGSPVDILSFNQPQQNHNGGWIGFNPVATGSAAYNLYIASGDGGGSDDNDSGHTAGTGNAQDITNNLLGKMLRINVGATGGAYTTPGNPFVGVTGDDEIFAYGLRNPYRASFDRQTGDLYIGDVGQSAREEIDRILNSSTGGENFGWRLREGAIATPTPTSPETPVGGPPPAGNVEPLYDYGRTGSFGGSTVTGGVLYRGPVESLQGKYFFADYGSDNLWTLDPADPYNTVARINSAITTSAGTLRDVVAFAEDSAGNVYLVDITDGSIYRIAGPRLAGDANNDGVVDTLDYLAVEQHFGTLGIKDGYLLGDANDDGSVNGADVIYIDRHFGSTFANPIVPEPATVALLALPLLARRRD